MTGFSVPILPTTLRLPDHFDDSRYYLPTRIELEKIFQLRKCRVKWRETFDCEDFAYELKTLFSVYRYDHEDTKNPDVTFAVGILWSGFTDQGGEGHTLNVVVTPGSVLLMDSKAGDIYPALDYRRSIDYIVI